MWMYQILVVFLFLRTASGEFGDGLCSTDPCFNGGTCSQVTAALFECNCTSGYTGITCDQDTAGSGSGSGDTSSSLPALVETLSTSCNGYDLMSDTTAIPDDLINIEYQESRKAVVDLFPNQAERKIPSVAMETLTIEFSESSEYWVQYIALVHDENVELNFTLITSQKCTNQTNGMLATIERTVTLSKNLKSGDHTLDLVIGADLKVCLSRIVINTQRLTADSDSTTFNAATGVFGCSIQPGDTTVDTCVVDDLLLDLNMYGSVYVEWSPTTYAANTLRPLADGLVLHQYMYPTVVIGPVDGYMKIEAATITGNIYSANITTDSTTTITLKETSPVFLDVTFDPLVTTSMVLVKPLLLDAGDAYSPFYNFTLKLFGCLSGAISTSPAVTTTTAADTTATTAEVTTATTTVSTATTTSTTTTTVTTPAPTLATSTNSAVSSAGATTDTATESTDITTESIHTITESADTTSKSSDTTTVSTDISTESSAITSGPATATTTRSSTATTLKHTVTSSAVTVSSSVASINDSCCMIICQGNNTLTKEEVEEKVKEIIETLTIPKRNISALRRKKTSAEDNRPSAVAVGGLGIALMVLWGSSIVIMDVDHIIAAYYVLRSLIAK